MNWYQPSLHSPQPYRERDAPRQRAAATRRRETEFTPPSSARTNGDDTRYYVYTYLVRIRTFTKIDFPFDEIYRRLLFFTLGQMYHTLLYQVFVYSLVVGGTHDTYVPPKKQLYCYLFIRWWVVVRMIPMFRPRNSCIAICLFVSGCWYHTNVPPVDAHV